MIKTDLLATSTSPHEGSLLFIGKIFEGDSAKSNTIKSRERHEVRLRISLRYCIIKAISTWNLIQKNLKVPIPN